MTGVTTKGRTMRSTTLESRAMWVTVAIVLGIAIGIYFGWPRLVAYWDNMTLKQAIKANSVSCLEPPLLVEGCRAKMLKIAREQIGLELLEDDLQIDANQNNRKIRVEVKYKARLNYPLTGTRFGASKDEFERMAD